MRDYLDSLPPAILGRELLVRRFERLPQWARHELDRLTARLHDAETRLAGDSTNSDTWSYPYDPTPTGLGRPQQIRHDYPEGMKVTIAWKADERALVIPTMEVLVTGGRPVVELGGAVNVAMLRLERDR